MDTDTKSHWTDEGRINELWYIGAVVFPPLGLISAAFFLARRDYGHAAVLALVSVIALVVIIALT